MVRGEVKNALTLYFWSLICLPGVHRITYILHNYYFVRSISFISLTFRHRASFI